MGEKNQPWWHIKLGSVLVIGGFSILEPSGLKDAFLSFINKKYDLGLSLRVPVAVGWILLLLGIVIIVCGEFLRRQRVLKPPFITFHHQSLEPFAARLLAADVIPTASYDIKEVDCDQSVYFRGGNCDPVGAVRVQLEKLTELKGARKLFHQAPVAYCGLAHIPLQFLAGCVVSNHAQVELFDLDRRINKWVPLSKLGPHVDLSVNTIEIPFNPSAVAIRICISYEVERADIQQVLPGQFEDIRIGLATPRKDAIKSLDQVWNVCERFAQVLDDIHSRVDKSIPVHIFYAGPAFLGFSLGRRISRTIHHRVIVHNYTPNTCPRYFWAVDITSQAAPEEMVVKQKGAQITK